RVGRLARHTRAQKHDNGSSRRRNPAQPRVLHLPAAAHAWAHRGRHFQVGKGHRGRVARGGEMSEQSPIRSIDGKGKTIKEILFARKFYIDYYQREYKWQTKQVEELINDLTGIFLNDFSANHDREDVAKYAHYFLGSIIISSKSGKDHIIDGQQ